MGGNSNLIDCNAIAQTKREVTPIDCFYFARLHYNLLNWSYLPFLFCAIALQSIKLELPPLYILHDCIAIYWSYLPFCFAWLHCNLLIWSCLPFLFCTIALQSIKLELPPIFCFAWLHCNVLNWSCLPFLFCAIALQSIKLELPPFFILHDCIAFLEELIKMWKVNGRTNGRTTDAQWWAKKGDNSNFIDCNAIAQNKKGRWLQFNRLQWNCTKYKREVTPI
jgi:hypothetical protein